MIFLENQPQPGKQYTDKTAHVPAHPQRLPFDWRLHRPSTLGEMHRHWHSLSEQYAGVDALFSAFDAGWTIVGNIYRDEYHFSKRRYSIIYYFQLERDSVVMWMPVLGNPYLCRQLNRWQFPVVTLPENDLHQIQEFS